MNIKAKSIKGKLFFPKCNINKIVFYSRLAKLNEQSKEEKIKLSKSTSSICIRNDLSSLSSKIANVKSLRSTISTTISTGINVKSTAQQTSLSSLKKPLHKNRVIISSRQIPQTISNPLILEQLIPQKAKSIEKYKDPSFSDFNEKLLKIKQYKLLSANINKSKALRYSYGGGSKPKDSIEEIPSLNLDNVNNSNNISQHFKRYSMTDRLILNLLDPDELMDDYVEGAKPFDRFTKFKKFSNKEKERVYHLIRGLKGIEAANERKLKVYIANIKRKKSNSHDISI